MSQQSRQSRKSWLITAAIGIGLFLWLLIGRGGLEAVDSESFLHILCDAFFIPGAMLFCLGLLTIAATGGAFDAISYGVKKVFSLIQKPEKRGWLPATYFDYVTARRGKPHSSPAALLWVGGALLAAAGIVLIFYFKAL